eukprot:112259_1
MTQIPTQHELRCAGFSFITAQLLWLSSTLLFGVDYDIYNVEKEADILALHDKVSSSNHRTRVHVAISLIFISFPFQIASLYGLKKITTFLFRSTPVEMIVYMVEKSYIIFITISTIVTPALVLVSVSFNWSFHEYTPDVDFIATGYYIQLYVIMCQFELIDSLAIADATFMISVYFIPIITVCGARNGNLKLKRVMRTLTPSFRRVCATLLCGLLLLSFFFIFAMVLFEFGKSGIHSPTGPAKFLLIWSFIWKLMIGVRLVTLGRTKNIVKLKEFADNIYDRQQKEDEEDDDELQQSPPIVRDENDNTGDKYQVKNLKLDTAHIRDLKIMSELNPVTPMVKNPVSPL